MDSEKILPQEINDDLKQIVHVEKFISLKTPEEIDQKIKLLNREKPLEHIDEIISEINLL